MTDFLTNHDVEIAHGPIGPERMKRGPEGKLAPVRMLRNGYIMRGKGQTVMMLGCEILDESVAIENIGRLNITKLIGFIKDGTYQPPVMETRTVPLEPAIFESVRPVEVDEAIIARMTPERIEEPCIILRYGFDHHIIDGRHRIHRRVRDGCPDITFHIVDGTLAPMFRIFLYTQIGDLWMRVREDTQALNAACAESENSFTKMLDTRNGALT